MQPKVEIIDLANDTGTKWEIPEGARHISIKERSLSADLKLYFKDDGSNDPRTDGGNEIYWTIPAANEDTQDVIIQAGSHNQLFLKQSSGSSVIVEIKYFIA